MCNHGTMIDPEHPPRPDQARLEGALERVRRVARHLPIGPDSEHASTERSARDGDDARVVVRPT